MPVSEQRLTWKRDGIEFVGDVWRTSESTCLGTIVVVHGLGEYSGRYEPFVEFWNTHGYDVITFDTRGHGRSGGGRGDAASIDVLVDDAGEALRVVRPACRASIYVYGHSLGGLVTLRLALLRGHDSSAGIEAFVVSAPAILPGTPQPRWKIGLGKLLRPILPRFGMDNGITPSDLSSDERCVPRFGEDPLLHRRISVRLGLSILEHGPELLQSTGTTQTPVLLMHGDADHVTSHDASRLLAERWNGIDFRTWSGLRHELHNELRRLEVLEFVAEWLARLRNSRR